MTTYKTAMCISPTLSWHGDSAGPVPVYDGATLEVLGLTDGKVSQMRGRSDAPIELHFGGVRFLARKHPTSQWYVLEHAE